ncbi:hypothetical protein CEE44_04360 [Candidatus Woesearchaeota archaeon B3_Woes]|nr:MAG: hypothetical protein CEE44_04360 [Candidatus Woesearchaeota archaeon B3_Woes]
MRRNKRAALNLSINAIVVLILAITMLGLGLSFMRNIFGSATQEFEEVGGTVRKQMIDQMKESDNTVDLSRPKVELKAGEETQIFIGFKNDGNVQRYFQVSTTGSSSTTLGDADTCNILDNTGDKIIYLEFKTGETEVLKGEVVVLPLNVKTSSDVDQDTCFYEIVVEHGTTSGSLDKNETIELTVDIVS